MRIPKMLSPLYLSYVMLVYSRCQLILLRSLCDSSCEGEIFFSKWPYVTVVVVC